MAKATDAEIDQMLADLKQANQKVLELQEKAAKVDFFEKQKDQFKKELDELNPKLNQAEQKIKELTAIRDTQARFLHQFIDLAEPLINIKNKQKLMDKINALDENVILVG